MQKYALLTAGIVFVIVSLLHLLRVIFKVEVKVGSSVLPQNLSVIGFLISLALALWMFKEM